MNTAIRPRLSHAPIAQETLSKRLKICVVLLVLANFVVPVVLSSYNYTLKQLILVMILLDVCLYPTFRYFAQRETGIPILQLLCLSFAGQYALPILTQEPGIDLGIGFRYLPEEDIESALMLTILGVFIMVVVYYFVGRSRALKEMPCVKLPLNKKKAEIFCLLAFVGFLVQPRLPGLLPEEIYKQFLAIFTLIQNQVLVGIAILGWIVYTGQGRRWHRILLYAIVLICALRGFSTTMMEQMFIPPCVLLMTKWLYTRSIPIPTIALIVVVFILLSPTKKDIRVSATDIREAGQTQSTFDRASEWIGQAYDYWTGTLAGERDLTESTSTAASRTDLIHSFSYIHSLTPSVIPYQYGETYSYLAVGWIPRAIWPTKPVANYANNFYAVTYEISTEEGVEKSTFGVSLLGEGYMNFGWFGVVLIVFVLGTVTRLVEHLFGQQRSGAGGHAIFLATFVYFINGIGTSTEMMLGGLAQNLIATCFLLWWVREKRQTLLKSEEQLKHVPLLSRFALRPRTPQPRT
jgi:hypothetical protein